MKIFIADLFSSSGIDRIRAASHEVIYNDKLNAQQLKDALIESKPQVLIVRSTKIPADLIQALPSLELIVRAGAGYDTIDVREASRRGVFVANCPGKNAAAVAELTIGLMVSVDRRIADNVSELRAGRWEKGQFCEADGLYGKTIGLIGFGNIGQEVAVRAKAFGLQVLVWSRSLKDDQAKRFGVIRKSSPLAVAAESDIVSVHIASTNETKGLCGADFFNAMKPNSVFLNTSRGDIVDENALLHAMNEKNIRAGLDVFKGEPSAKKGQFESAVTKHPNVYGTHHIGASTRQAENAIGDEAVRIVLKYAVSGEVPNCVNIADNTPATHMLTIRHYDRVGVLAHVLDQMRRANWNVQEMENLVFQGAEAACARIRFIGSVDDEAVEAIRNHPDILAVSVTAMAQPSPFFSYTQRPATEARPAAVQI
eukprot:GILJ01000780.1.p1 GENE.GILJ01000780.1~~GILJ01000780.1.p1  ORF type:complete len:435 (-),score=95.27 GILJ01000780.1:80-1354(-)